MIKISCQGPIICPGNELLVQSYNNCTSIIRAWFYKI